MFPEKMTQLWCSLWIERSFGYPGYLCFCSTLRCRAGPAQAPPGAPCGAFCRSAGTQAVGLTTVCDRLRSSNGKIGPLYHFLACTGRSRFQTYVVVHRATLAMHYDTQPTFHCARPTLGKWTKTARDICTFIEGLILQLPFGHIE